MPSARYLVLRRASNVGGRNVQRLSARRTQSRLGRIIGIPEYAQMTIRNWSTTTKLRSLLDERGRA